MEIAMALLVLGLLLAGKADRAEKRDPADRYYPGSEKNPREK